MKKQPKSEFFRQRARPIDRQMFLSINHAFKQREGQSNVADRVGELHGVSTATVYAVRRARTWPKFLDNRKVAVARYKERQERNSVPVRASKQSASEVAAEREFDNVYAKQQRLSSRMATVEIVLWVVVLIALAALMTWKVTQ